MAVSDSCSSSLFFKGPLGLNNPSDSGSARPPKGSESLSGTLSCIRNVSGQRIKDIILLQRSTSSPYQSLS